MSVHEYVSIPGSPSPLAGVVGEVVCTEVSEVLVVVVVDCVTVDGVLLDRVRPTASPMMRAMAAHNKNPTAAPTKNGSSSDAHRCLLSPNL
jgi:hypothetical protein